MVMAVAMSLGVVAVYVPARLHGPIRSIGSPVFDWFFSAWKHCNCVVTLGVLFLIGLALALVWPAHWKAAGCSTMLVFPIFAVVEMVTDPNTHTIFPIEFAFYGFFTLFSLAGAAAGMWFRRRSNKVIA
jgi:hypothetical protein